MAICDRQVIGHRRLQRIALPLRCPITCLFNYLRQASNLTQAFAAHCVAVAVSDYLPVHFLSSRSSVAHGLERVQGVSDYLPVKKVKILMSFLRFWCDNVTKP